MNVNLNSECKKNRCGMRVCGGKQKHKLLFVYAECGTVAAENNEKRLFTVLCTI